MSNLPQTCNSPCAGAQLMVAFGDGTMSGCTVSGKTLGSVWNVPLGEPGGVYHLSAGHFAVTHSSCVLKSVAPFTVSTEYAVDHNPLEGTKPAGIARAFVRAQPHPLVKGACLIVVGTSSGYVTAWELTDTRQ
jgi:hypothetical protein